MPTWVCRVIPDLAQALFLLTGFRSEGRPNRYFQPWDSAVLFMQGCGAGSSGQTWACPECRNQAFNPPTMFEKLQADSARPLLVPACHSTHACAMGPSTLGFASDLG